MRLATIRDDADYQEALAEIERLMSRSPTIGSEEADRLDVLSVLVEEYEKSAFPIDLPSPVEAITFRMEQMGLKQRDLIPYIGSRSRVSEVLSGKRPLSLTMMRALHRGLGIPASVLLRGDSESLEPVEPIDWRRFPLREMANLGWIDAPKRISAADVRRLVEEFFRPIGRIDTAALAMFRRERSRRSARTMDSYALAAWCARVKIRALDSRLTSTFSSSAIDREIFREIAKLSARPDGPRRVPAALAELGIHFVIEPHLSKTHLDGAAILSVAGEPIIALTLRHDRLDSFWFCLLHELAHVAKHLSVDNEALFDDMDASGQTEAEKEADRLAREALVPSKVFRRSRAQSARTPAAVVNLANRLEVHPAVVAGRIRLEAGNYRLLGQLVGQGEVRRLFPEVFSGDRK